MASNVVDLDTFRAREGNEKRSVADTLREVARGIDAGEIKPDMVYVAMREPVPGGIDIDYIWSSSINSRFERVGLLARHLHIANDA